MSPDPSRHVPLRQPTAFHVPVCLPPLPAANRKTCLLARPAMSLCARQHHSRDQAVSLPARSYSCNPSWGGGGGGGRWGRAVSLSACAVSVLTGSERAVAVGAIRPHAAAAVQTVLPARRTEQGPHRVGAPAIPVKAGPVFNVRSASVRCTVVCSRQ
jgi:hypothetical protein